MQKPKLNTFVIPILRSDLIDRCLETLYKYTEPNFYVFIVDQSIEGLDTALRDKYANLMVIRTPKTDLHSTGNLGHSQATNLAMRLAETPYVTFLNDDVEFIHKDWWQGVMDTFIKVEKATPERPPLLVNVGSIKLPDWSVGRPKGEDHYIMPYKEQYTDEDWRKLVNEEHYVNEHLTITPGSVIDGINLYCSVADTKRLIEVGMVDDFFYPGGANDYDLCCRASMFGYRCVGTTLSWVFHHWSQTFQDDEQMQMLVQDELKHLDLRDKWGNLYDEDGKPVLDEGGNHRGKFDLWGVRCSRKDCDQILHTDDGVKAVCPKHPDEVFAMPENTFEAL